MYLLKPSCLMFFWSTYGFFWCSNKARLSERSTPSSASSSLGRFFGMGRLIGWWVFSPEKQIQRRISELWYHTWVVVSNIFYFHPYLGKMNPFWRAYFSKGLKPPTRYHFKKKTRTKIRKLTCNLHETNKKFAPEIFDGWKMKCPFGARPISKGNVSFR